MSLKNTSFTGCCGVHEVYGFWDKYPHTVSAEKIKKYLEHEGHFLQGYTVLTINQPQMDQLGASFHAIIIRMGFQLIGPSKGYGQNTVYLYVRVNDPVSSVIPEIDKKATTVEKVIGVFS